MKYIITMVSILFLGLLTTYQGQEQIELLSYSATEDDEEVDHDKDLDCEREPGVLIASYCDGAEEWNATIMNTDQMAEECDVSGDERMPDHCPESEYYNANFEDTEHEDVGDLEDDLPLPPKGEEDEWDDGSSPEPTIEHHHEEGKTTTITKDENGNEIDREVRVYPSDLKEEGL